MSIYMDPGTCVKGRQVVRVNRHLSVRCAIALAAWFALVSPSIAQTPPVLDNEKLLNTGFRHAQHPIVLDAHQLWIAPEIVHEEAGFEAINASVLALGLRRSFVEVNGVWVFRRVSSQQVLQGQSITGAFKDWLDGMNSEQMAQLTGDGLILSRPSDIPDVFRYVFTSGEIASSLMRSAPITMRLGAGLVARVSGDTRRFVIGGQRILSLPVKPAQNVVAPEWISAPYTPDEPSIFESEGEIMTFEDIAVEVREKHGLRLYYDARLQQFPIFIKGSFSEEQLVQALSEYSKSLSVSFQPQEAHQPEYAYADTELLERLMALEGIPQDLLNAVEAGEAATASEWRERFGVLKDSVRFQQVPDGEVTFGMALVINFTCDEPRSGNMPVGSFILHVKKP